jgi:hypothetical protein
MLAGLLGLSVLVGFSAPASAGDVTACGDFSGSSDTRFDIQNNIAHTATTGVCLKFPTNSVVYLNGFIVGGRSQEYKTIGIKVGSNSFVWGPGIVKAFGTCIGDGDDGTPPPNLNINPPNDVAVEGLLLNNCATGINIGESYKIKEVRIHDCTPSTLFGIGMLLGRGGFIESSIVRSCDYGVITGQNNKIWNLVVTNHLFTGLQLGAYTTTTPPVGIAGSGAGNAVSRTVISHPRSTATKGIDYTLCGTAGFGCQDGSNSVSGHTAPLNIVSTPAIVIEQPTDNATAGATNCNGANVVKLATGPINGNC